MSSEQALLAAAREGGQEPFGQLVEPYRAQLLAHCYRMLGSHQDAEDALQDALLSAWRALPEFEGRSSLRSWLYTIATNASLKAIERRRRRVLPIDFGPAADPHDPIAPPVAETEWLEPFPDTGLDLQQQFLGPDARYEQRESIELAFVAALQHLPAKQRAVLILRDVLGFSAREVAETLDITPVAVDSALQRAHRTVDERLPDQSQQATLRVLGDDRLREIVARFVAAWERADVDSVVSMLAEDVTFTMPPVPNWYRGRDAVGAFMAVGPLAPGTRWRVQTVRANGQAALAQYLWSEERGGFLAHAISVLTIEGSSIADITIFRSAEMLERFGLPAVTE